MRFRMAAASAAFALSLGLAACEQPVTSVSNNVAQAAERIPDEPGVANIGNAVAEVPNAPSSPQEFVVQLAASDQFEILSGQLAMQKGQSDAVKGMGEMLVEEHRKSSEELKAVLAASNAPVQLPSGLTPELQARLQALQGVNGAEFDRRWLAEQIAAHQQTYALLNGFLGASEPSALKTHAAKANGVIQKHLNELNQVRL